MFNCVLHKPIINKTQEMSFHAKCTFADHMPAVVHGEEIAQANQYKYLGVHLDKRNLAERSMCQWLL